MRALTLAIAALVACASEHKPPAPVPAAPVPVPAPVTADAAPAPVPIDAAPSTSGLLQHGEVCAYGIRHPAGERERALPPCGPGLQCCYPCGIQGCDSVCHTPEECRVDMRRP